MGGEGVPPSQVGNFFLKLKIFPWEGGRGTPPCLFKFKKKLIGGAGIGEGEAQLQWTR